VSDPLDDQLWSAIGDPTRRRLLDVLLTAGSGTSTTLSEQLPVSRQAVAKHLAVLTDAGLVHGRTTGRERRYSIDEEQFARALAQLQAVSSAWDGRLRRITRLAEALHKQQQQDHPTDDEGNTP
jgi:DNA-binding transcriptional ArsR family regulator